MKEKSTETPDLLPIVTYGQPVLRQLAKEIDPKHPDLKPLIARMFASMYNAGGVGLAAPQVGQGIRLFVVDAEPMNDLDEHEDLTGFRRTFLNPKIEEFWGDEWGFDEGCLSIPGIRETVYRKDYIRIRYLDENLEERVDEFRGIKSRIIQHEYDHIEGVLFTDRLSSLKKQLLRPKLSRMAKGKVEADYPILPAKG